MQNKNQVADSIFGAIDVIVDKKLQKLNFDYTIVAKVIQPNSDGTYTLEYQNAKFRAAPIGNVNYTAGQFVYVVFPGNNSSRLKFIYGALNTEPQAATYNLLLQREINQLKAQQEILINALTLALEGDTEQAQEKLNEIQGGNNK